MSSSLTTTTVPPNSPITVPLRPTPSDYSTLSLSLLECVLSCVQLFATLFAGSSVHGILQATILEHVAILFSSGSSQPRDQTQVSSTADSLPSEPPENPQPSLVFQVKT